MVTAVSWMNCEFAWRGEPCLGDLSRRQAWDRDGRSLQCARTAQGRTQHLLEEEFGMFTVSDFGQISALCLPVCWDFGYFPAQRGFCLARSPSEGWYHLGSSYSGAWASLPCSVCNPAAPLAIIYSGQSLLFFLSYCLISVAGPSQLFCVPVLQCRQPAVRGKDLDKCKSHPLGFWRWIVKMCRRGI